MKKLKDQISHLNDSKEWIQLEKLLLSTGERDILKVILYIIINIF